MSLYLRLMYFAGIRHGVLGPKLRYKDFISGTNMQEKFNCRQKLIENENSIPLYLTHHSHQHSREEINILSGFSLGITDKFIIYKLFSTRAVFTTKNKFFYVHALGDPFDLLVDEIPCLVKTTILPFLGKIVYDGFLEPFNIEFGPNILHSLRVEWKEAKEKGIVIKKII
ncbi:MAG: hypothetical protein ABJC12_02715 [Saprospiraceae bacterium]